MHLNATTACKMLLFCAHDIFIVVIIAYFFHQIIVVFLTLFQISFMRKQTTGDREQNNNKTLF